MSELRERKRRRTMALVQSVALDLFEQYGFEATTIEQIAERAEVSPSTIYRQFGTKEGLIIHDEWDADEMALLRELVVLPDPLIEVGRFLDLMGEHLGGDGEARARRRMAWVVKQPSVRRAAYGHLDRLCRTISETLIEQRDVPPVAARVGVHALMFGVYAALEHWYVAEPDRPVVEIMREAMDPLGDVLRRLVLPRQP